MEDAEELERFFSRLADEAGTPSLTAGEAAEVLDLTRVVAHQVERRLAPLTSYALGVSLDPRLTAEERTARVRALVEVVKRLAREVPGG